MAVRLEPGGGAPLRSCRARWHGARGNEPRGLGSVLDCTVALGQRLVLGCTAHRGWPGKLFSIIQRFTKYQTGSNF
jgi:hypothetical protein